MKLPLIPERINLVLLAATVCKCGVLLLFKHPSPALLGALVGFAVLGFGLGRLGGRLAADCRLLLLGSPIELARGCMCFCWTVSLLGLLSAVVATPWSFLPEVMLVPAAMGCLRSARMKPHDAGVLFA